MSVITDVENEVKKIAGAAKTDLEKIFGAGVDPFLSAAESLLKTDAGKIISEAVALAKTQLPNGIGAVLHAFASGFASAKLQAAGISIGTQLLNLAIETVLAGGA